MPDDSRSNFLRVTLVSFCKNKGFQLSTKVAFSFSNYCSLSLSSCLFYPPTPTLLLIFWLNTHTKQAICYYYEINDAMGFNGVGKWINIVMQIMLICKRKIVLKINIAISLSALLFLFLIREKTSKRFPLSFQEKKIENDFGLNCLWKCNNIQTTSFWRVKPIMKCARTKWPFDELSWIAFYLLP